MPLKVREITFLSLPYCFSGALGEEFEEYENFIHGIIEIL